MEAEGWAAGAGGLTPSPGQAVLSGGGGSGFAGGARTAPLEGILHIIDEIAYTLQSGDELAMMSLPFWNIQPFTVSPFPPGWPRD